MGPDRSLEKVQQELNKKTSYKRTLARWSVDHDWVDRVSAYDEHLVQMRLAEKQRMASEVHDAEMRHYRFLLSQIDTLKQNIEASGIVTADNIETLLSMMKKADDFGRRAVGLPDRYTDSKIDADVSGHMTWEEMFLKDNADKDTNTW